MCVSVRGSTGKIHINQIYLFVHKNGMGGGRLYIYIYMIFCLNSSSSLFRCLGFTEPNVVGEVTISAAQPVCDKPPPQDIPPVGERMQEA